jgi:hypothetical protein
MMAKRYFFASSALVSAMTCADNPSDTTKAKTAPVVFNRIICPPLSIFMNQSGESNQGCCPAQIIVTQDGTWQGSLSR